MNKIVFSEQEQADLMLELDSIYSTTNMTYAESIIEAVNNIIENRSTVSE